MRSRVARCPAVKADDDALRRPALIEFIKPRTALTRAALLEPRVMDRRPGKSRGLPLRSGVEVRRRNLLRSERRRRPLQLLGRQRLVGLLVGLLGRLLVRLPVRLLARLL